jgi:MFS transporter, PPP family, 3-phenylpropionic acid transporter
VAPIVLLFLLTGIANAVFSPFGTAILAERGISPTWIGLLGAIVSLAFVAVAGAWGHVADVVLGRARAMRIAVLVSAALLAVFALPLPVVALGAVYVAYATTYGLVLPLADALAVNALRDPARQYGPVRGFQSGVFAVAALAAGAMYARAGYGPAVPLFVGLAIVLAFVAGRLPDVARARLAAGPRGGAMRRALATGPRLPRALFAIGMANVGVFAGMTFLPLLILRLGGGPTEIGLAVSLTAIVEVVAMPVVSRLLARFGARAVVTVSCALLAVVFGWWAVAPTPAYVVAAAVLYGSAWSGMWVGSVTTVRVLLPASLQGSGQTLLAVTTAGVAAFVANVGGAILWAGPGPLVLFGIAAACAVVGALFGWLSLPERGASVSGPGRRPRQIDEPAGA